MPRIEFISSQMPGFYGNFLQTEEYSGLLQKGSHSAEFFKLLKDLQAKSLEGSIKDYDDFRANLVDGLPAGILDEKQTKDFGAGLDKMYQNYHKFYEENKPEIIKYKDTMDILQDDKQVGYTKELEDLYGFFGVDKSHVVKGVLAPVQSKKIDGAANSNGFFVFYSANREEAAKEYIDDSLVIKRKASTPLHEATHFLFAKSELKKNLAANQGAGVQKLRETLQKHFAKFPEDMNKDLGGVDRNIMSAVDEALAASSSAIVSEKFGQQPGSGVWYSGFPAANKLAAQTYPLFKEYLSQGKPMDDEFYMKLAKKFYAKEKSNELKAEMSNPKKLDAFLASNLSKQPHQKVENHQIPTGANILDNSNIRSALINKKLLHSN